MSKVITIKPHHATKKEPIATLTKHINRAVECPVYTHPSDDYIIDHVLHGAVAHLTGGISPIALSLAGFDWWSHLISSPAKMQILHQSLLEKTLQINNYAMQAALVNATAPVTPSPADHRFVSDGWRNFPFNLLEQGFLLTQNWWDEATSGIRGVSEHHLNVTSFTARQLLDIFSPSNNPIANPDILQTTQAEGGRNFWQGT